MTVPEAEKALGVPLRPDEVPGDDEPDGCRCVSNALELPDLAFMVIKGRIVRVDVGHGPYRTASGARVGDSEQSVQRLDPGRSAIPASTATTSSSPAATAAAP